MLHPIDSANISDDPDITDSQILTVPGIPLKVSKYLVPYHY
jgi:hypothetical protein